MMIHVAWIRQRDLHTRFGRGMQFVYRFWSPLKVHTRMLPQEPAFRACPRRWPEVYGDGHIPKAVHVAPARRFSGTLLPPRSREAGKYEGEDIPSTVPEGVPC